MAGKAWRKPEIEHVTVIGKIKQPDQGTYLKLVKLAHEFSRCVSKAVKMLAKGLPKDVIVREITKDLNLGYADTIYKIAKLIVEGCKTNGSNPLKAKIKKKFIISRGFSSYKGNRNVRLVSTSEVLVRIPKDGWIRLEVEFGRKYLPLIGELVQKSLNKELSYTAKIVFRNGKIYLHVSVPLELYLKYFGNGKARGELTASFDVNSDRINMVIVDRRGIIRDVKVKHFPEVTSHGFPKDKAKNLRLNALAELLNYAYHHGVGIILFEDLELIKSRKFTKSKKANRKISKFAKAQLLQYGMIRALRMGFEVYLVNPSYTSKLGKKIQKFLGIDIHTASAYLLALKFLGFKVSKIAKVSNIS